MFEIAQYPPIIQKYPHDRPVDRHWPTLLYQIILYRICSDYLISIKLLTKIFEICSSNSNIHISHLAVRYKEKR